MLGDLLLGRLEIMAYPLALFVGHPRPIAFVAVTFLVTYWFLRNQARNVSWVRPWPLLVLTVLWGLWMWWECVAVSHRPWRSDMILRPLWQGLVLGRTGGGRGEIRVDLLAILPLVFVATVASLAACVRWREIDWDTQTDENDNP